MSVLIDDLVELREITDHLEHLLILSIRYIENSHCSIGAAAGLGEVAEWWKEHQREDKDAQTKELQQLANGIWECYEKGTTKYIDPADVERIVELARNAKIE